MNGRTIAVTALVVLLGAGLIAQVPAQAPAGQAASSKGVVIKAKAPVSTEVLQVKLPRPQEADLANGLHLMVIEDHRAPQIAMQIILAGAGGYYDPEGLPGLAAATAGMVTEGTTTRTAQQIAREQEAMAASVSVAGGGSSETATLMVSSLTDTFDKALALAADILLNPSFPEQELARLKTRQQASLVQLRSSPGILARERYAKVIYGDHPAGRVLGTPESIDKITRDAIVEFHRARYVPDAGIVGFVGDITLAEARKKVEAFFGAWKKAGLKGAATVDPADPGPAKVHLVDRPGSVQTSLVFGAQAINRTSPDYDVMSLLNAVIGGGPTGRLFLNLREDKGWTYGAYSGVTSPPYRGDWAASTEIRGDVTHAAVAEVLAEIERLRTEPIGQQEFMDKKRSLIAGFALSLETPSTILSNYITSRRFKLPADYWDRYPERVMGVTQTQLQAAAKKYLAPERIQIVAVGDAKKIGEGLGKFGAVELYDTEGKVKGR